MLKSKNTAIYYLPSATFNIRLCLFSLLILILLVSTNVQGQQLSFNKVEIKQGYRFHYQWLDYMNAKQSISFTLEQAALFDRFRHFKTYQNSYAQKTILRAIKKKMQKAPIPGVQVYYRQKRDSFFIEARGLDKAKVAEAYQTIARLEHEVTDKYLKDNYYQAFTNHDQISGIKVDHVSMANDSVADLKSLKPIILDKVSIENIRKASNYVLGFVQSIPYSTLESRLTSSGAGFNPPLKLLWENQGDCDSKMTLTATLLRALMPRIDMVFVYIDGHAFIGIDIPAKAGEITIEHEGVNYLLAEPTGPALLPLGKLAPESELAINQGHYVAENYHEVISEQQTEPDQLKEAEQKSLP